MPMVGTFEFYNCRPPSDQAGKTYGCHHGFGAAARKSHLVYTRGTLNNHVRQLPLYLAAQCVDGAALELRDYAIVDCIVVMAKDHRPSAIHTVDQDVHVPRSAERRVGQDCISTGRS